MNALFYAFFNAVETGLRGFPVPCRTGLVTIGSPDRDAPVFLTCNYHLTVLRVKRALQGMNCYLLVANSKGYNVWCGAAGGHFTNHSVVSALNTSGIQDLVDHRRVVLPQLAATGVEGREIKKRTGWTALWGPVYARDIPPYTANAFSKTREMRKVRFPVGQRLEMAVMWAFPFSIIASLLTLLVWPDFLLPVNLILWSVPLLTFLTFPLYSHWLNPQAKRVKKFSSYTVIFDFGKIPLVLWILFLAGLLVFGVLIDHASWEFMLRWGFASLLVILIISIDLMGSTPLYKSGLHEDRMLKVRLDVEKCKGAGFCEQVCPRDCYEVDHRQHTARIPRADLCVQCGACIVQCPFDALQFVSPGGDILTPETIRKHKLNLIGKRLVSV